MKRLFSLLLLTTVTSIAVPAQNPCMQGTKYRGCRACGSATSIKGKRLNVLKNRNAPATNPQQITIAQIRNPANDSGHFNPNQQVSLTGFVASLDNGGYKESCNCGREDLRDIHINVVANPSERNDKAKWVVVEITPRWQARLQLDDSNYEAMLATLRSQIVGKWVRFEGWMLADSYHAKESKNTAPPGTPTCLDDGNDPRPCIWRSSRWEVHPVTKYTVVIGP